MRQTPFGVWNSNSDTPTRMTDEASMRQTPFGVWNLVLTPVDSGVEWSFNEADAFRRLEWPARRALPAASGRFNEADAFRRLE